MVKDYWGAHRACHYTAPINMIYALGKPFCLLSEEGLEARFARYPKNNQALVAVAEASGLFMFFP